jgi:UDP-4-amino-4-deoxy-L-arabinose-oxoglutarate aminotransferase
MKPILHSKPWLTEEDHVALLETLASGMIGQGEKTEAFEQAMSRWVGLEESGVAVASGAAALLLALKALDIGPGSEVVMPTYVCRSVLEAVISAGATPVCCDVGRQWVVTPESLAPRITLRARALILPHIYGVFVEVQKFRHFGLPIIEDCAQAVDKQGRRMLAGDIGVFSFHPTKCLTTGEGGMAVSANKELDLRLRQLRDGSSVSPLPRLFSPLSDLAAALGLSQLARYDEAVERRVRLARLYRERLSPLMPGALPELPPDRTMWFRFPLTVAGGTDRWQKPFADRGIHVRKGVDQLLHRLLGLPDEAFPQAVRFFNETVSLPIYPALDDREHAACVEAATEIFGKRGGAL